VADVVTLGTVPAEAYQMAEEAARAITTGN